MNIIQKSIIVISLLYFNSIDAQENTSSNYSIKSSIVYSIEATTSDENINENINALKKENNINLEVKNIKRNNEGKIIGINLSYQDNNGNSGSKQIKGTQPIKPIVFKYEKNKDGEVNISLSTKDTEDQMIRKYYASDIKFTEDGDVTEEKNFKKSKITTITIDKDGKSSKSVTINDEPIEAGKLKILENEDLKNLNADHIQGLIKELDFNKLLNDHKESIFKISENNELLNPNMKELKDEIKILKEEIEKIKKEVEESKKELKNTNKK
jgi:hypothetical protein